MAQTAADILIESLHDWGVEGCFRLPATASTASWKRSAAARTDSLHPSASRRSAAFMASGYAKYTGKLGVCLATSGPEVFTY